MNPPFNEEADMYVSEFPELESKVHVMIEKMHEELPVAIDNLVGAYDNLVAELRQQVKEQTDDNS